MSLKNSYQDSKNYDKGSPLFIWESVKSTFHEQGIVSIVRQVFAPPGEGSIECSEFGEETAPPEWAHFMFDAHTVGLMAAGAVVSLAVIIVIHAIFVAFAGIYAYLAWLLLIPAWLKLKSMSDTDKKPIRCWEASVISVQPGRNIVEVEFSNGYQKSFTNIKTEAEPGNIVYVMSKDLQHFTVMAENSPVETKVQN